VAGYPPPAPAGPQTHHYVRPLEGAVLHGQAVARGCLDLKKSGFMPDVVYAHPGWGKPCSLSCSGLGGKLVECLDVLLAQQK